MVNTPISRGCQPDGPASASFRGFRRLCPSRNKNPKMGDIAGNVEGATFQETGDEGNASRLDASACYS